MSQAPEPQHGQVEKPLFESFPMSEQQRMVEAILFAATEPVSVVELTKRMPDGCDPAEALICLSKFYEGRGVRLMRIGNAWAFRTSADLAYLMQNKSILQRKLSRAAIETLAIVAYHQPVTRPEIEEIRGVAVSRGTVDFLIELDWIRFGRRRMSPGRPATFIVTEHFLDHFGLESARDLPGLKDLRAAGLLDSRSFGTDVDNSDDEGDVFGASEDQSELFE
jgi:segregation and condensation protein B